MRYLITTKDEHPFLTNWFDYENNYVEGMVIYNLRLNLFTTDGKNWREIYFDHF